MIPFDQNPFLAVSPRRVVVRAGEGPYANMQACLAALDLRPATGRRVLLKPNAGRLAAPESGVTTHPQAVAAAIDAFQAVGAEVAVGESPITGVDTMEAFDVTGIAAVARERACPLIDLDVRDAIDLPIPDAVVLPRIKLCADVPEYDFLVSLPVMKMHMHTGVTLAVKNLKGCLWRRSKVELHMLPPVAGRTEKPIDIAIADMATVLRPHLSLVDGYIGMEGLGPSAGQPRTLDVALVGADPFAADAAACALMGVAAAEVPHLRLGAPRCGGVLDLAALDVEPDDWQSLAREFARPPVDLAVQFPGATVIDCQSCSACQSTLLLFLKRYGKAVLEYFPEGQEVCFAIGKGTDAAPDGAIFVGNCTARQRARGTFVKGCPPVASEILTAITGRPAIDSADGHSETPQT